MVLFRRRAATAEPVPNDPGAQSPAPQPAATPPVIEDLLPEELVWMDELRVRMVASHRDADGGAADVAALYERVRNGWWWVEPAEREDSDPLINGLGVALGDALVQEAGLRWVLATDALGSELAVVADEADMLVYPINVIAKRWGDEHSGSFLVGFIEMVVERVRTAA